MKVFFNSGKVLSADALLYTVGRQASTDGLNLEAVGLSRNHRGLINVNKNYQTDQPHMYDHEHVSTLDRYAPTHVTLRLFLL